LRCSSNSLIIADAVTRSGPKDTEVDRQVAVILYAVAMAAIIVGVDLAFFLGAERLEARSLAEADEVIE